MYTHIRVKGGEGLGASGRKNSERGMFIRVMEDQVGMRYLVDFWARNWEDMSGLRGPGGCWETDIEAVTLERRQRDRAETGIAMTVGLIKEACWRKRKTQVGRQKRGPQQGVATKIFMHG